MLTPEQQQLASAVDTMRANDELITKFALALKKAEHDRDAYYKHLEVAQAEVAKRGERIDQLGAWLVQIVDSLPWTTIAHDDEDHGLRATLARLGIYEFANSVRVTPSAPAVQATEASANTTAAGAAPAPAAQADAWTPSDPTDDGRSEDRFSQNRD